MERLKLWFEKEGGDIAASNARYALKLAVGYGKFESLETLKFIKKALENIERLDNATDEERP